MSAAQQGPSAGVVVYSGFPSDARVAREARALREAGVNVSIVCLRGKGERRRERVDGIEVYRVGIWRSRKGRLRYLLEYALFIGAAFYRLSLLALARRLDMVHAHNMPDVLVFASFVPRLLGARVLLDLHDPMPEVYMTKYDLGASHPVIRVIAALEQLSIAYADRVITPNEAFRELFVSRGCPPRKISVVMNTPDDGFCGGGLGDDERDERDEANGREGFVLMYHGLIVRRHGLDLALEALEDLSGEFPHVRMEIFGDGDFSSELGDMLRGSKVNGVATYHGYVPLEAIPHRIREADLGVIPNRAGPFTNLNMPTRVFEYLAMGKPVIAPRTKGIQDYFPEDALFYFKAGDAADLARVMRRAIGDEAERRLVTRRGISVYRQHMWRSERRAFLSAALGLISRPPARSSFGASSFGDRSFGDGDAGLIMAGEEAQT